MRRYIFALLLSCLYLFVWGQTADGIDLSGLPKQTRAESLRYWFDDDVGTISNTSQLQGEHTIDANALHEGVHTLHYQLIDNEGKLAAPYSAIFLKFKNEQLSHARKLRYWFDDNDFMQFTNSTSGVQMLDVSSMVDGVHTIHYQVIDDAGNSTIPYSSIFLKFDKSESATGTVQMKYWFDGDRNTLKAMNVVGGVTAIDVSNLIEGVHTLHCQLIDNAGTISYLSSAIFMKMANINSGATLTASRLLYWFDDETSSMQNVEISSGIQMLDASGLSDGVHTIHYQVVCSDGSLTSAYSSIFMRLNIDTQAASAKSLRYWFDDSQELTTTDIADGVQMLDASGLSDGVHTIHYQVVCDNGTVGIPVSSIFMKINIQSDGQLAASQQRYWFDDDMTTMKTSEVTSGVQMLDVTGIQAGVHTLHYQLVAKDGTTSSPYSAIFIKSFDALLPTEGNVITRYMYWTNDNSAVNTKVDIPNPSSPYQLITLLPVEKADIRSYSFQFEVTNGKPMMYAKNDFHIRFYDASGYWVDDAKPFIDYSISQEVTDIEELLSTQTFARPAENAVKWFKVDVEEGDTVAFKSSQATSIQVFSPSGKEVYSASGDKSVKFDGCHTWEDGTYYVAVHDVTGTKPNVTLDYMHMDKYDVVDQDVRVVGNGGCSSITYQGNGFRDLYAVDLYTERGDTIHSVDVNFISDATTIVTFDFSDTEIGKYHALFHFTGEDKKFLNNITVEAARDIELATKVSYPSTFLRGTSTTYTIEIKNKGNMTAYYVPVECKMLGISKSDINQITIDIGKENSVLSELLRELADDGVLEKFDYLRDIQKDIPDFVFVKDSINNLDYGLAQLFIRINPNSTSKINVCIKSNQAVNLYAYVPQEWHSTSYDVVNETAKLRVKKASAKEWLCCYKDRVECVTDVVSLFIPAAYGCAASIINTGFKAVYDIGCTEGDGFGNRASNYFREKGKSLAGDLAMSAVSCITKYFGDRIYSLMEDASLSFAIGNMDEYGRILGEIVLMQKLSSQAVQNVLTGIGARIATTNCYIAFTETKPNCPPNPGGGGGTSTPINSCEPNEIRGYTSESGSTFMRNDVEEVTYIIDSENDPVFADAPAHTVIITDTINGEYYDLESLSTRNITIGDVSMDLDGTEQNFIKTMDLRPRINVIAQVEQKYDTKTGIAKWIWTSLDPMTMEPTDDVMQGVLPVNDETHIGEGHVTFKLKQKMGLPNGTDVTNQADIVFDSNEPVFTPVWTNTIDAIAPISAVVSADIKNDTTATLKIRATDNLSGPWKYDVYVRYGTEGTPWFKAVEGATDTIVDVRFYQEMSQAYCVIATDSAGNTEQKELVEEMELSKYILGDANCDKAVDVADITAIASHILGDTPKVFRWAAADANQDNAIDVADITTVASMILGSNAKADLDFISHSSKPELIANSGESCLQLKLVNTGNEFSAFQTDIYLPAGVEVEKIMTETKHNIAWRRVAENTVRVMIYSLANETFSVGNDLLNLILRGQEQLAEINIVNGITARPDGSKEKILDCSSLVSISNPSGIESIQQETDEQIYNVRGQKLQKSGRGVNIIRSDNDTRKVMKQ